MNINNPFYEKLFQWIKTLDLSNDKCSQYALQVINKEILTSKYIYYICLQHFLFLYKEKHEPNFPFTYKKKPLEKLINFSQKIIVPEINKPFIFPDFRKFMAGYIWGWRYKNNLSKLMVQNIFDVEARKQWKSSFWSMIMLAVICGFNSDYNAEIYVSGPQAETSKIPFTTARNYIGKSPIFHKYFTAWNSLHIKGKRGGIIKPLAFEKSAIEGKNPSMVILTEYHLHKNDEMQESAQSSRNLSRNNQLIVYDTTKGHDIDGVCFNREKAYKKYLEDQINNPEKLLPNFDVFLWAAELDDEDYDNWEDSSLWIKANPNLGVSVSLDQLIQEYHKIDSKQSEIEFQTKRLGMWVNEATSYFSLFNIIESDKVAFEKIQDKVNDVDFLRKCNPLFGLDLSSIHDTTHLAVGFEIPQDDGESIWYFQGQGYIPEKNAMRKEFSDQSRYTQWAEQDICVLTPGEVVDYEYVVHKILDWKNKYKINQLGYDPWQFNIIKEHLIKKHHFYEDQLVKIPQGVRMTPFFKAFERKLRLKKITFGHNNMIIQHITHVTLKHTSLGSDNFLIQKISQNKRIDAFMSILNIIAQWCDKLQDSNESGKLISLV